MAQSFVFDAELESKKPTFDGLGEKLMQLNEVGVKELDMTM